MNRKKYAAFITCLLFTWFAAAQVDLEQLEQSLSSKTDTAKVNLLNRLSWEYRRIDTRKAMYFGNEASAMSEQLRYWQGLAYSYKNRGSICSINGAYSIAKQHFHKALQQFKELNNITETGNIYNLFGLLYWETGKYDLAIAHYKRALADFRKVEDEEGKAMIFSNIGIIYYEMGRPDDALEQYVRALSISERRNDRMAMANIHTNIGLIYSQLENYPKALSHYWSSLRSEKQLNDLSGKAKSYTNIGVCYFELGNTDKSLLYHRKAMQFYRQVHEQKGISHSLINIGSIHHRKKEYAQANTCFLQAFYLKQAMEEPHGEVLALTHLGRLRCDESRWEEAASYLERAYRKAYSIGSLRYQAEASLLLAETYDQIGSDVEAMRYYKIHLQANDSLLRRRSSQKLTELQIGFETQEKEREIARWKKETARAGISKRGYAAGGVLLACLSLVIIGRLRRSHREATKRLEAELALNRQALMEYTRHLLEKHSLSELNEQFPETEQVATLEDWERMERLNQLAGLRIVTDEDWEKFKQLYQKVFPYFMIRLKEHFPGITQAELRLSALITLQLSSKEISLMLGISSDSVKKARQRLRKKMELDAEEDLDDVISGFNDRYSWGLLQ